MAKIKLTRGYEAEIDDEDFTRINSRKWFASVGVQVRAARMANRQMIYLHYEVLQLSPMKGMEIDHIDGNPLNNHKENLRCVSHTANMRNTLRSKNKKGVAYNARAGLWMTYIDEYDKKRIYLGYAKTEEEAFAKKEAYFANLQND